MQLRHLRVLFSIPLDATRLVTVVGLHAPVVGEYDGDYDGDYDAAVAVSSAVQK
jgi:hypothetical protein